MNKLILNFEGEYVEIPSGFAYERIVSQIGMIIEHDGKDWAVVGRRVLGVDKVAQELREQTNYDDSLSECLTLIVELERR